MALAAAALGVIRMPPTVPGVPPVAESSPIHGSSWWPEEAASAAIRPTAFRPPMRSITSSASTIESCTDTITASPTSADGNYPRPGGTEAWASATNIYSANNTYATCTLGGEEKSKYLRATGFELSGLPNDARIRGIAVSIRRYASAANAIKEAAVTLVKEDYTGFSNESSGAFVGTSVATVQYGGATEDWGEPYPVPSSLKASNFGVLLGYNNELIGSDSLAVIYIDHVEITVHYNPAPECTGLASTTAWAGYTNAQSMSWENSGNATGPPDGSVATGTATSGETTYLVCTDFDLDSIDPSHVIDGVRVTIKARVTGAAQRWHYVECRDALVGQISRGKWPFLEPTGTSLVNHHLGDCEDYWPQANGGENLFTPDIFNGDGTNRTFFVLIQLRKMHAGTSSVVEIDAVSVTVWHHAP